MRNIYLIGLLAFILTACGKFDEDFAACPKDDSSCVSSLESEEAKNYFEPLSFDAGSAKEIKDLFLTSLTLSDAKLVNLSGNYIQAEVKYMFVVPVKLEIYVDSGQSIVLFKAMSPLPMASVSKNALQKIIDNALKQLEE